MLPESVLKKAAAEMLDYEGTGQSVMEMSHRSKAYDKIIKDAEALLREVMNIPDNYKVLFLQGGGSTQFAMVALNLMNKNNKADYIVTGQWAKKALQEAQRYGDAVAVASSADKTFTYIPKTDKSMFREDADYVYICLNNTIYGTVYHELPDTGDIPLVADISSCIVSEPLDVSKFGLLFAGAQKNMSGLYNTPPWYAIYVAKLVLEWIKNEVGGLDKMKELNEKKAKLLYDFLDSSELFKGTVVPEDRSLMNVPFVTGNADLDAKFVKESTEAGFVNLKGHRTVGGMRASIYNAMPYEGVEKLVEFMKKFEADNK